MADERGRAAARAALMASAAEAQKSWARQARVAAAAVAAKAPGARQKAQVASLNREATALFKAGLGLKDQRVRRVLALRDQVAASGAVAPERIRSLLYPS